MCDTKMYLFDSCIPHAFIQKQKIEIPSRTYQKELQQQLDFSLPKTRMIRLSQSRHCAFVFKDIRQLCRMILKFYKKNQIVIYLDFDFRFMKDIDQIQNIVLNKQFILFFEFLRLTHVKFYLVTDQYSFNSKNVRLFHKLNLFIPNLHIHSFIFVNPKKSSKTMEVEYHVNAEWDRIDSSTMIHEIYQQIQS